MVSDDIRSIVFCLIRNTEIMQVVSGITRGETRTRLFFMVYTMAAN